MTELRYEMGTRSPGELQRDLSSFIDALGSDETLAQSVRELGVEPDTARQELEGVTIRSDDDMGTDPGTIALIVAFAPVVNRVVIDLWKSQVLPWIRHQMGDDAIGPGPGDD